MAALTDEQIDATLKRLEAMREDLYRLADKIAAEHREYRAVVPLPGVVPDMRNAEPE